MFTVAVAVALLAWSVVGNLVWGDGGYVVRNLAATGALLILARRAGLDRADLGLTRDRVASGTRWGGIAVAVTCAVLAAGVVLGDRLGPLGALLDDDRAALPAASLAWVALVRIPLGTVVFEELAFRGVLDGALHRRWSVRTATIASAAIFGIYHLPPTWVALRINDVPPGSAEGLGALAGAVVATGVAGALFTWLRRRSGSLLAPALAHVGTNVGGLLAAAWAQRGLG
jgi:uncharacterized protein